MKSNPLFKRSVALCALIGAAALASTPPAMAYYATYGAVNATVNYPGTNPGSSIADTYNQNGLSPGSNYVSGVTDWSTYFAGSPTHSASVGEWFSAVLPAPAPVSPASVTYDLGSVLAVGGIALWNEEIGGVGEIAVYGLNASSVWTNLLALLPLTDHGAVASYGADVYGFGNFSTQFIRVDMSKCSQPNANAFRGCSLGEVAFAAEARSVPEPNSLALAGLGFVCAGVFGRSRSKAASATPTAFNSNPTRAFT